MAFGFLKKIAKVAGAPFKVISKVAMAPVNVVGSVVKHIPVVGKPLSTVIHLGNAPLDLINRVASGDRVDKAILNNLKSQVKDVKEVAPYAQMVVSLVPGVGTAVSAAISAGGALVSGQPITAALVAGIKGAIPGGAIAQTAFSVTADLVSGKSVSATALNALPLTDAQKSAVKTVVSASKDLASGKSINKIAIEAAQKQLPPDVQKAISIGTAIGFAAKYQKTTVAPIKVAGKPATVAVQKMFSIQAPIRAVNPKATMQATGQALIRVSPTLMAGHNTLKTEGDKRGFQAAVGMMNHKATEAEISKFNSMLAPDERNGFNIGAAAIVGSNDIDPTGNPAADFGASLATGLKGASVELKTEAIKTVASNPVVKDAIIQVATANKASWIHKVLVSLGFIKE